MPDESQAIEADGFGGLKGRTIDGDPAAVDELLARHRAATRDEADRLHVVLDRMTGPDRTILGMRTCEGLSYEEAATRLGIEPAAARRRYGRALLRLRASLLAGGQTESNR
jgi:DNA-directed RNA polymerase specialized sigma24 family protein